MSNATSTIMPSVSTRSGIRRYAPPSSTTPTAPTAPTASPEAEQIAEPMRLVVRESRAAAAPPPPVDALPAAVEQELISILEMPAPPHLTSTHAFKLREEALLFVMSALTIAQSKRLHTRLCAQMSGDALVAAFYLRLVADRRNRILQFLSQAPRRQALRNAR